MLLDHIKIIRSQTFADMRDHLKFQEIIAGANRLHKLGLRVDLEVSEVRWKAQLQARAIAHKRPRGRNRRIHVRRIRSGANQGDMAEDSSPPEIMTRKEESNDESMLDPASRAHKPNDHTQSGTILQIIRPLWTAALALRPIASQIPCGGQEVSYDGLSLGNNEWILVGPEETEECQTARL